MSTFLFLSKVIVMTSRTRCFPSKSQARPAVVTYKMHSKKLGTIVYHVYVFNSRSIVLEKAFTNSLKLILEPEVEQNIERGKDLELCTNPIN